MDMTFILKLQTLRNLIGKPLVITSGYRCAKHNAEVGGEPDSAHLYGWAADIQTPDHKFRFNLLLKAVVSAGISRIGFGENFLHLDIGDLKNPKVYASEVIWDYYPKG